ncbi:hypothetical protein AVEN_175813-1 [Araneus ventricosus]|uniref:Uncharacterized protein n=1 Tax=Araneus ventricosus TaxID=182803 RepID=A0A4Y2F384_ARAVE|nr:hypothetical protein AVEN_175813-1 [Araneus ventricosus]
MPSMDESKTWPHIPWGPVADWRGCQLARWQVGALNRRQFGPPESVGEKKSLSLYNMCGPSLTPGNHYFQTQSATDGDNDDEEWSEEKSL